LLYPDNDANIYKDDLKNKSDDERDMRRSSTKPEGPKESKSKSREEIKSSEDDEDKPK